jgi:hypothetical protein
MLEFTLTTAGDVADTVNAVVGPGCIPTTLVQVTVTELVITNPPPATAGDCTVLRIDKTVTS